MLIDTVFSGLEDQLKLKIDRMKVIYLKMPYKGVPVPSVIRKRMDSKEEEVWLFIRVHFLCTVSSWLIINLLYTFL